MPRKTATWIADQLIHWGVYLTIKKPRTSKYGDYQAPSKGKGHRITINGDLNRYAFFTVFVHELAHLQAFVAYGYRIKAHGKEWKQTFKDLMMPFTRQNIFPPDLNQAVIKAMQNPPASSCSDPNLIIALKKYDPPSDKVFVSELSMGQEFVTENGRLFVTEKKLRKRIQCKEISSGKVYLFNPIAEVLPQ